MVKIFLRAQKMIRPASMIEHSFLFLEGIQERSEQKLFDQGICSWDAFLREKEIRGISRRRKLYYDRKITRARSELYKGNSGHFTDILPKKHHWLLFEKFYDEAVYIDIETDGNKKDSRLIAISLFDSYEAKTMIRDVNLDIDALRVYLSHFKYIISFNGSCFDTPFINRRYQNMFPDVPHMDLRFLCAQLGLKGSLKEVENMIGITREGLVSRVKGGDPSLLWRMLKGSSDPYYLDLLVRYNQEDVINLQPLAKKAYSLLSRSLKERLAKAA